MKAVSQPMAQKLQDAGWSAETDLFWQRYIRKDGWYPTDRRSQSSDWLPRPTLDEVLEDLSLHDFKVAYCGDRPIADYITFCEWLYTTMRSADAAADVWIKTRGKG